MMDVLNRAHVQASGGLDGDDQRQITIDLAGDDGLLLVTAGHGTGNRHRALTGAHIVLLDQVLRISAHRIKADKTILLELRLVVALQHQILLQGIVQDQAVLVAILRDMGHARLRTFADGRSGHILPAQDNLALGGFLQAGDGMHQLTLAVAVNAGDAHNFTRTHSKGHILDCLTVVQFGLNRQVLHRQHRIRRSGGLLVHHQLHIAAHHHAGKLRLVGIGSVDGTDVLALAQHRAAVRHGHDLRQLMGDEEDGLALSGQTLHDLHQLVNLLRSQHGCGLVKDEHLIVAIKHLEDLHALLHAHRDIFNFCVQIHFQAVALGQRQHLLTGLLLGQEAEFGVLRTQDDIVQHGKHIDQLKVLMHHTDMQGSRIVGVVDLHNLAVLADLALIRLIQTKQHAHQRRFACTVFTQQCMDLTPAQLERNIIICFDAREFLGNVEHFDHVLRYDGHAATSLFMCNYADISLQTYLLIL